MLSTVLALALPVFAMSCDDGGDSNPFTQADFPLCGADTTRLVGTIDDMSIDVTLPGGSGGGLSQDNAGGDYYHQGIPDPTQPDLFLAWDHLLASGRIASATGTVRLVEGPFANQTICAGEGTQVLIPKDDNVAVIQFSLAGLRSGDGCAVAHTGQLRGCVQW
jgi:hypothetical protein